MNTTTTRYIDIVRGALLVLVFQMHALYLFESTGGRTPDQYFWFQMVVKSLAPQVAAFFILAGMTSRQMLAKPFGHVLGRSLMLIVLAYVSHIVGVLMNAALYEPWNGVRALAHDIVKPLLHGTDLITAIAWFFIVLGIVRLLVYWTARNRLSLTVGVVLAVAIALLGRSESIPYNFYEWQNWPAAYLLFLFGMRVPTEWRMPAWLAVFVFWFVIGITLANSPQLLSADPWPAFDAAFVSQPMVGQYGLPPVYFTGVIFSFVFLFWFAQVTEATAIGRGLRYFGRASLQFLLLHGWVIVVVYPPLSLILPQRQSIALFFLLFFGNMALHAALYQILKKPLNKLISLIGTITDVQAFRRRRLAGAGRSAARSAESS